MHILTYMRDVMMIVFNSIYFVRMREDENHLKEN